MARREPSSSWILRRKEVTTTTWRFRLLVLAAGFSLLYLTHGWWLTAIGRSLVHEAELQPADLLLVENLDAEYDVFETAAELMDSGIVSRVLVPVPIVEGRTKHNEVEDVLVREMSRIAGLGGYDTLPVAYTEPISLNTARQVAPFLEKERIRSVIVVTPRFRSARSYLIYDRVFRPLGIRVQCRASDSTMSPDDWWGTLHGVQEIGLAWLKLLYYRFWVL